MTDVESHLPNLVMIGVAKAGTTSLFDYLTQHPQICGSDEKELFYFSALRYNEPLGSLSEYAAHFGHCGSTRYRMEASPGYYFGGRPIIDAMQSALGEPRVLLILRNPVDRLWSYYSFERSRGNIAKDLPFDEYLATCQRLRDEGTDGLRENNAYWGLASGFYSEPLKEWLDAFGDHMLVVFFEHLASDPAATVGRICDWAGIDSDGVAGFDYGVANKTVQHRSAALRQMAVDLRERNRQWLERRPAIRSAARRMYYALNGERTADRLSDSNRARLDQIYAASNVATAAMLREHGYVDLPEWLAVPARL